MNSQQKLTIPVEGMTCASCVGRVERALAAVQGVTSVSVNLATETAMVDGFASRDDLVQTLADAGYPARIAQTSLNISEMTCASCVARVERALAALPAVVDAQVNLATETANVRYLDGELDAQQLVAAIAVSGYAATLSAPSGAIDRHERKASEARELARMTTVAALLALPVFIMEMGGHLFPALHRLIDSAIGMQASWMIQFVLATIVLAWPGRGFYRKGIPALARGAPDMNSLVALGTAAAYGYSIIVTFFPTVLPVGSRAVYFEAAAVIVVLILLGRTLEARAKGRTGAAIQKLVSLRPKTARVLRADGPADLAIDQIVAGDILKIRPGERIALDGEVRDGLSWVDESMISGEPEPVEKAAGAAVVGGTVNGTGTLDVRVTHVGADTVLARIINLVETAQAARLPIQGLVDRITLYFVPAVMIVAVVTVGIWLVFGTPPALAHAMVAGVSVLIIACPCAMGLATPTSIVVGTGRAAGMGVLFRKGDALQELQAITTVALDKTGTLTAGRPELTDLIAMPEFAEDEVLALTAGAEAASEHPIAAAIMRAAKARGLKVPEAKGFTSITGYGVRATVDGHDVVAGADRLMVREGIALSHDAGVAAMTALGRTPLYVAIDGTLAAVFGVADPIKPGAPAAIAALRDMGLRVAMITGDNAATAHVIAAQLGIETVVAEVLPEGKVAAIDQLRSTGKVAFVGDGINDAPALAAADVGIAIGTGTDVAIETADLVLMSGDVAGVVNAVAISRATIRNIRQNLFWAFGYNIALIPVAAGAMYPVNGLLLSPALAAGAMAMSSVFVLSNALRLRWVPAAIAEHGTAPARANLRPATA